jgi:hypothetical protein
MSVTYRDLISRKNYVMYVCESVRLFLLLPLGQGPVLVSTLKKEDVITRNRYGVVRIWRIGIVYYTFLITFWGLMIRIWGMVRQ